MQILVILKLSFNESLFVINPGSIITSGVTIGKNSIVSPGSVVTQDVPDHCVVVGNPARVVKKIE